MSLPAYLQNLPSRNLAQTAISNVGQGNPPYLSIEGNRFTLVDVAGNTIPIQTLHVDVVIVDVNDHVSKIYFDPSKPYDPNTPTPPLCFSDNGIAPSINAGHPQAPTCASCPNNVWGSKISQMGSAVKACADQQKIAIYVPEYSDGLFLLRIPPGSFINWRGYMAKFAGAGLDPDRVITRISFQQGVMGTLMFQSPGYITEQQVGTIAKMIEAKAADGIIGRLDKPRTAMLPSPQGQLQESLPNRPQAQPVYPNQPNPVPNGPFTPAASPTPPAGPVAATQPPAAAQQPVQRRRRTKAEMEAARAQAPVASPQPQQAPFRPDPAPNASPPAVPQAQFGIVQNPPAPPPGLDLDAVFK